ncbi:hypothetical protein B296_00052715, partial [Ensete ventricosum]
GAAEDLDGEDTEVRAEGAGQEDGLRRSPVSNVVPPFTRPAGAKSTVSLYLVNQLPREETEIKDVTSQVKLRDSWTVTL